MFFIIKFFTQEFSLFYSFSHPSRSASTSHALGILRLNCTALFSRPALVQALLIRIEWVIKLSCSLKMYIGIDLHAYNVRNFYYHFFNTNCSFTHL